MANTMVETRPTFARLTEKRHARSWRAAVPAVVVVVALVALLAYLASSISSSSQRAMAAERDSQQVREQMGGMAKQIASLQKDDALAKAPGRTTVIVEPQGKKSKEGAAWAAATWGELPDGKTFLRVNAYGLLANREAGKEYHVWFRPQEGDPVDLGGIDVDPNGGGFTMASELPAIDQGKEVMLTSDPQGAKEPGEVLARADLPKLTPAGAAAPK